MIAAAQFSWQETAAKFLDASSPLSVLSLDKPIERVISRRDDLSRRVHLF
jgi:hypothetical protein